MMYLISPPLPTLVISPQWSCLSLIPPWLWGTDLPLGRRTWKVPLPPLASGTMARLGTIGGQKWHSRLALGPSRRELEARISLALSYRAGYAVQLLIPFP